MTGQGRRFIDWWADRLRQFCYDEVPNGLFTDQRWVDLAPGVLRRHRDRARARVQRRDLEPDPPPRPPARRAYESRSTAGRWSSTTSRASTAGPRRACSTATAPTALCSTTCASGTSRAAKNWAVEPGRDRVHLQLIPETASGSPIATGSSTGAATTLSLTFPIHSKPAIRGSSYFRWSELHGPSGRFGPLLKLLQESPAAVRLARLARLARSAWRRLVEAGHDGAHHGLEPRRQSSARSALDPRPSRWRRWCLRCSRRPGHAAGSCSRASIASWRRVLAESGIEPRRRPGRHETEAALWTSWHDTWSRSFPTFFFADARTWCWPRATPRAFWRPRSRVSGWTFRSDTSRPACAPAGCSRRFPKRPTALIASHLRRSISRRPYGTGKPRTKESNPRRVHVTGNTVIDALLATAERELADRRRARSAKTAGPGDGPSSRFFRRAARADLLGDSRSCTTGIRTSSFCGRSIPTRRSSRSWKGSWMSGSHAGSGSVDRWRTGRLSRR